MRALRSHAGLLLAVALVAGCTAAGPRRLDPDSPDARNFHVIAGIGSPAHVGGAECGAAAAYAVLAARGKSADWEVLRREVGDPSGATLLDIRQALVRHGVAARIAKGDAALLADESRQGRPVVALVRVRNRVWPPFATSAHFLVMVGEGRGGAELAYLDTDGVVYRIPAATFHGWWARGGWGAVVLREAVEAASFASADDAWRVGVEAFAGSRHADARRAFEAALAVDPGHRGARLGLAAVARAEGSLAEAEEHLRAVLARTGDDAEVLNNLAWIVLEQGKDPSEAVALARRAAGTPGGRRGEILDTLAWALHSAGEDRDALDQAREAIALMPARRSSRDRAVFHLGMILLSLGDRNGARRALADARGSADADLSADAEEALRGLGEGNP